MSATGPFQGVGLQAVKGVGAPVAAASGGVQ